MLKVLLMAGAATAIVGLSACAEYDDGYYPHRAYYSAADPYDVWYDGYYGPYTSGYWGEGGIYFYSDSAGVWHGDRDGHFRHGRWGGATGYRSIHRP
jgi:hypothetical protein